MSQAISTECARAAKKLENLRVSASKIELGSVRASPNHARVVRFEQQNAKKSCEAQRFFFVGSNGPARARKCAVNAGQDAQASEASEDPFGITDRDVCMY